MASNASRAWAFLYDAHPSMPVPVDASLVPWAAETNAPDLSCPGGMAGVSTDEESCGKLAITPPRGGKWVLRPANSSCSA